MLKYHPDKYPHHTHFPCDPGRIRAAEQSKAPGGVQPGLQLRSSSRRRSKAASTSQGKQEAAQTSSSSKVAPAPKVARLLLQPTLVVSRRAADLHHQSQTCPDRAAKRAPQRQAMSSTNRREQRGGQPGAERKANIHWKQRKRSLTRATPPKPAKPYEPMGPPPTILGLMVESTSTSVSVSWRKSRAGSGNGAALVYEVQWRVLHPRRRTLAGSGWTPAAPAAELSKEGLLSACGYSPESAQWAQCRSPSGQCLWTRTPSRPQRAATGNGGDGGSSNGGASAASHAGWSGASASASASASAVPVRVQNGGTGTGRGWRVGAGRARARAKIKAKAGAAAGEEVRGLRAQRARVWCRARQGQGQGKGQGERQRPRASSPGNRSGSPARDWDRDRGGNSSSSSGGGGGSSSGSSKSRRSPPATTTHGSETQSPAQEAQQREQGATEAAG